MAAAALGDVPEPPEELASGRWALRQVVSTQVHDPNPFSRSGWATVTTTGWGVVDYEIGGDDVTLDETPCAVETSAVLGTTTTYTPEFVTALKGGPRTGKIVGGRLQIAWEHRLGPSDDDGDGRPGVTVHVRQATLGSGDVWVEQVSTTRWDGARAGGGWRGGVVTDTRQTVIDGERWWLKLKTASRPNPDPSASWFELVPFTGGCSELAASRGIVFSR